MEHLESKPNILSIREAVLEMQRVRLEQQKAKLVTTLADIAKELTKIDSLFVNPEARRTKLIVELEWYRYDMDTYVSGYVPDNRYQAMAYEIDTYDAQTAWLGLLATQPKALAELPFRSKDAQELSAYVSSSIIENSSDETVSAAQQVFSAARTSALTLIHEMLIQIKDDNPYRDIPIVINESALHDTLVRQRILQECHDHDPLFAIRQV